MFYMYNELTPELSVTECLVYSFIHGIYFRRLQEGETRFFRATNRYIADQLGISQRTVTTVLQSLEEKHYIKVWLTTSDDNTTLRNVVPVPVDMCLVYQREEGGVANFSRGGVEEIARGASKNCEGGTQNLLPNNKSNNKSNKESIIDKVNASVDPISAESARERWNAIAKRYHLQTVNVITKSRTQQLRARIKDAGSEDAFWTTVEKAIAGSAFLRGQNDRKWRANFDFFLRQSSFVKAAEGAYSRGSLMAAPGKPIEQQGEARDEFVELFFNM